MGRPAALQDDFDDYGDDPPDLQEGSGLQADAPLPLFPRRRPSAEQAWACWVTHDLLD